MDKKFAVPFSGAANNGSDSWEGAAKAAYFPEDQVDESRKGALRGAAKYSKVEGCDAMQSTGKATDGFSIMKKMETF